MIDEWREGSVGPRAYFFATDHFGAQLYQRPGYTGNCRGQQKVELAKERGERGSDCCTGDFREEYAVPAAGGKAEDSSELPLHRNWNGGGNSNIAPMEFGLKSGLARQPKLPSGRSGGIRTCNQTVMSGRIEVRSIDFTAFSSEFAHLLRFGEVVSGAKLVRWTARSRAFCCPNFGQRFYF